MAQVIKCPRCATVVDDGMAHMAAQHDEKLGRDEWISAIVEAWPPLTPSQLDRLSVILRPTLSQVHVDAGEVSDVISEMME